jgi:hypothetical protein
MKNKKFEGEVEILGHRIRLENLRNPNVIRAVKERENSFLFNYTDHSDHNDKHKSSSRYNDYYDHTDSKIDGDETKGNMRSSNAGIKWNKYNDSSYSDSNR